MIFQHTASMVLDGSKSQTRRLVKSGDGFTTALSIGVVGPDRGRVITTVPNYSKPSPGFNNIYSVCNGKRTVYAVGKDYAVQPGRGKPAVARIRITGIRREDVRNISDEDVKAEGFDMCFDFWAVWTHMHDKPFYDRWINRKNRGSISERPTELYTAWVITFELVR